ncbi:LysR family transcriptional regulator [Sphingobium sp. SJ10-10]|uniref:LysR family transcriptional regulator n=1 Tax=Sphingobium sp. SJ10-10 TaxID=3114999 RepID=UPI002E193FF6|nr:LysR family transcriptional regulator [Sphingobium sp. SJ10-10]
MRTSDISKFDFNLLRALHVLLRERNVTRAANDLHVTQQAMSGSLKRLRQYFDDPLFIRVGQHLEPTPMALALVAPVRDAMRQIAMTLETTPTFAPEVTRRHFRVAMSDHASLTLLPDLIANMAYAAPGITYEIQPVTKHTLYHLDLGELDLCVMPQNLRVHQSNLSNVCPKIRSTTLFDDCFVCVIDANNPTVGQELTLDQYVTMHHAALKMTDGLQSLVEVSWINAGIAPHIAASASSFASLICMVPGTPLVATVHRRLAYKFKTIAPLRILDCPVQIDVTRQQLNWHYRNDNDPTHRFVREAMVSAGATMQ